MNDSGPNLLCDLPFELLEMIFEYLERDELRSLLYCDNRVHDVVVASPISMRKLKLNLNESWREKVSFIREFGECVKALNFEFCNFDFPSEFCELMKSMRSIESLKVANVHIEAENFNKKYKILLMKFGKLRHLSVDNSQAVGKLVRLYLRKVQVKSLRLDFSHYNVHEELVELLQNQRDLQTLEMAGFNNILYSSLFRHDISYTFEFELKKLILNHRVIKHELFLRFLKALPLVELEVNKEIESQDFFNVVFAMETLRSLTLATNFVTLKNIDFKKAVNSKLRELVLVTRNQYGVDQTINFLVTKLYDLRTLKIVNLKTDSSDQLLGFVHLKSLEKLHIENSKLKFLQNIKLDHLRSLHLHNVHPFLKFEAWEKFFLANRKIEEVVVTDFEVYYVTEAIKNEIGKIINNLHPIEKSLRRLDIFQELRYSKPIKVSMRISESQNTLKVSDSFIKVCREDFHYLRKLADFHLTYYADDYFELNNKYLK